MKKHQARSTSELYNNCTFDEWQTISTFFRYHDLINIARELYIKLCLEMQRHDMWKFVCDKYAKIDIDYEQFRVFENLFYDNGIDPQLFAMDVYKLLTKSEKKINALRIIGTSNTGKSLVANLLASPFICCYMNNHGSENEFFMSNMLNKCLILCEELYITIATAEDFKSVLGGQPIDIAKKFNEKQMLNRTPCIITSNHSKFGRGHLPAIDENALVIRCFNYVFNQPIEPGVTCTCDQLYKYLIDKLL